MNIQVNTKLQNLTEIKTDFFLIGYYNSYDDAL